MEGVIDTENEGSRVERYPRIWGRKHGGTTRRIISLWAIVIVKKVVLDKRLKPSPVCDVGGTSREPWSRRNSSSFFEYRCS